MGKRSPEIDARTTSRDWTPKKNRLRTGKGQGKPVPKMSQDLYGGRTAATVFIEKGIQAEFFFTQ